MSLPLSLRASRVLIHTGLGVYLLLVIQTVQAQKVWESDQSMERQVGRVHVHMSKNTERDAEPDAFSIITLDRQTSARGVFRGVCSPVVAVNIRLTDARKVDLSQFAASRNGTDLPIDETLSALRENLQEQCNELQVIRLRFDAINKRKENYDYTGTLTKANGWRLQDGKVATDYDGAYVFSLHTRSPFSPAGIRFRGHCEKEPTLLLEPIYQNNTERADPKPISMVDFMFIAKSISVAYADECSGVTQIRYALNPMPDDYLCKTEGDCFMEAVRQPDDKDPWAISREQFKLKEYYHPVVDARDMFEVLAAGRFDILRDYEGFFRFYFENWFGAYSDNCKAQLSDPVGRKTQVVERTFDNGVLVDEDFGPERHIWIERAYAEDYDRYFGSSRSWATTYVLNKVMGQQQREARGPVDAVFGGFGFLTGTIDQLEALTEGNCTDDRLLTAQTNMVRYARKQPPANTDSYPTDKRPLVKYANNGPSAPAFTRRWQEERRQSEQARRERNRVETSEDWLRRQATIQREIQRRSGAEGPAAAGEARVGNSGTFRDRNELIQDQQARVAASMQGFQKRMTQATNPAERQAIQQEMRTYFSNIRGELEDELQAFDRRRQ